MNHTHFQLFDFPIVLFSQVNKGKEEFEAMLDPRWVKPNAPVLILSLVQNASTKSVPSIEVAEQLNLLNVSRPWQVIQRLIKDLVKVCELLVF